MGSAKTNPENQKEPGAEKLPSNEPEDQRWKLSVCFEGFYCRLKSRSSIRVEHLDWQADLDAGEERADPGVCFEVCTQREGRVQNRCLWIWLWMNGNEAKRAHPVWILVLRENRESLWQRLKNEFENSMAIIDDEYWAIGLPLAFCGDASMEELRAVGKNIAERIIDVLLFAAQNNIPRQPQGKKISGNP